MEFTEGRFTTLIYDQHFTVTAKKNLYNTTGQSVITKGNSYELVISKAPNDPDYRRIYLYPKGTITHSELIEERHYGSLEELNNDFFMNHYHDFFKKGGKSRRNRKAGKSKRNRKAGKSKRRKSRR
jgi:hypothetical protein